MSLFDVEIYFREGPLALKVMCPCLKQPQFVVGEVATSFQDVHTVFFSDFHTQCLQKIKQKNFPPPPVSPVPNFCQTATGSTGIFLYALTTKPR